MSAETKIFTTFEILDDSFKKLFDNFWPLCKYMLYPVLGQLLGILIALVPAVLLSVITAFGGGGLLFLPIIILGALIGLPLFCHAFWKYIIRTAALCIISKELITTGQLTGFKAAEEQIRNRTADYIKLLLWIALICIVLLAPIVTVCAPLLFSLVTAPIVAQMVAIVPITFIFTLIGFVLPFSFLPTFALNKDFNAKDTLKNSFELAKNHATETLLFLSLIAAICTLLSVVTSVPLVGILTFPFVAIITALLIPLLITHCYLRLEAKKATSGV